MATFPPIGLATSTTIEYGFTGYPGVPVALSLALRSKRDKGDILDSELAEVRQRLRRAGVEATAELHDRSGKLVWKCTGYLVQEWDIDAPDGPETVPPEQRYTNRNCSGRLPGEAEEYHLKVTMTGDATVGDLSVQPRVEGLGRLGRGEFGTIANLVLSICVTVYGGIVWLRRRAKYPLDSYRFVAYQYWWASWLAWVLAWSMLLANALLYLKGSLGIRILTLAFDNLNSVFMVIMYFVITRGERFGKLEAKHAFVQIIGSLVGGTVIIYILAYWLSLEFAYQVHETWSLCLGVIGPLFVGWGCNLRFNTQAPLAVGFVYGMMQPIIYASEHLTTGNGPIELSLSTYRPVVAMTLAALKVVWAIIVTQVLIHGGAEEGSLVKSRPRIHSYWLKKWRKQDIGQSIVLVLMYGFLLVMMLNRYENSLTPWSVSVGLVMGGAVAADLLWKLWDRGSG